LLRLLIHIRLLLLRRLIIERMRRLRGIATAAAPSVPVPPGTILCRRRRNIQNDCRRQSNEWNSESFGHLSALHLLGRTRNHHEIQALDEF
jgi:hypothetical protein